MTGAENFCAIRSYLATAARHGTSRLDALIMAAQGDPWIPRNRLKRAHQARTLLPSAQLELQAMRRPIQLRHTLLHMAICAAAFTILGLLFVTLGTGIQAVTAQHEYRNLHKRWRREHEREFSRQTHPSHYGGGHSVLESVALWLARQFEPVATAGWYLLGSARIPKVWNNVSEMEADELAKFAKQAAGWTLLLLGSVAGLAAACISLAT
jgi:hypothetical protein